MKTCLDCKQTLQLSAFTNNKSAKDGLCVYCRTCMAIRNKAYRNKDQDAWQKKQKAYQQKYRAENVERLVEYRKKRYPQIKARVQHHQVLRKRKLKERSFPHEKNMLIEFYRKCPEGHHVDHIVPISNPLVCGLHVIANLQYLPATDNLKKTNKFEVI